MCHDVEVTYSENCSKNNALNCWDTLKLTKLQHSGKYTGVNAKKLEKISKMTYG